MSEGMSDERQQAQQQAQHQHFLVKPINRKKAPTKKKLEVV